MSKYWRTDLLPLGYACAALVFEQGEELQWLKERFASMQELFEESRAYREMVGKGITIEKEQGLKEGEEKGHLEDARQTLIRLISKHHPALISFAEQQTSAVNDLGILHDAVDALFEVSTVEQARQILAQITEK